MCSAHPRQTLAACAFALAIPTGLAALGSAALEPADEILRAHPRPHAHRTTRSVDLDQPPPSATDEPLLHIPLVLNLSKSALTLAEVESTFAEVNRIWAQAGICFEARDLRLGYGASTEIVLWLVAGDVPGLNGYYESNDYIWIEDQPRLRGAPTPARLPAGRTAAHELGHALGLQHVPPTGPTGDSLMNTGYDGYRLQAWEIAKARETATQYAHSVPRRQCRPPML